MLDGGIASGEDEHLAAVIGPPNEVRGLSLLAVDLEDLGALPGVSNPVSLDHKSVAGLGLHHYLLWSLPECTLDVACHRGKGPDDAIRR